MRNNAENEWLEQKLDESNPDKNDWIKDEQPTEKLLSSDDMIKSIEQQKAALKKEETERLKRLKEARSKIDEMETPQ